MPPLWLQTQPATYELTRDLRSLRQRMQQGCSDRLYCIIPDRLPNCRLSFFIRSISSLTLLAATQAMRFGGSSAGNMATRL